MKDIKNKRVALIIPAYNESEVIMSVIKALDDVFKKSNYDYKIIVVDDGSQDNTSVEAKKAGAYVIKHILNTGSGGATATGLSYANQNNFFVATTSDADGQHNPKDVLNGIDILIKNNLDLLNGSRLIDDKGMSRVKILGNKGLSFITNIIFGVNITDSQSGLRVFSKHALINLKWKTSGYEYCSEMLWRAKQLNLKIDEFPIDAIYTEYSKAKGQNNWNGFNIIKILVKRRVLEIFGE
jgi:glycosyltransferase involved in cell wall biosynthesis